MEDIDFLLTSEYTLPVYREDPAIRFSRMQREVSQLIPDLEEVEGDEHSNLDSITTTLPRREKIITTISLQQQHSHQIRDSGNNNETNLEALITKTRTDGKELEADFMRIMEEADSYIDFCLSSNSTLNDSPTDDGISPFAKRNSHQQFEGLFSVPSKIYHS